ncbi:ubiquitin carboxyl-terminal hydrolase 30 [Ischnura elegans]|uniref:ubiquitin carboxyl-terminal hydrolase 30 n=1 Tax=Ischnura elegans TaxID=197161 RepID=UPI001ED88D18|nr:ubiquitin carboxyl-terminal hydrolase 30 [Ischnura elegans]
MDSEKILFLSGVSLAVAVGLYVLWGPTTTKKRKKAGIIGLVNLGHTCFLNTLLQALASCPTFISWLSWHANREFRFRDGYSSHNRTFSGLAAAIYKVILVLNGNEANEQSSEEGYAYAPYCVLEALGKRGWAISPGEQDAHELFHALLSTIGEEIEANNAKVPITDQDNRPRNGLSFNIHKPSITDALTPSDSCGEGLEHLRISNDNQVNEGILSLTNDVRADLSPLSGPLKNRFPLVSHGRDEVGPESFCSGDTKVEDSRGNLGGRCDGGGEESGVKIVLSESLRGSDNGGLTATSELVDAGKCGDLLGKDLLSVYASSYPGSPNASRSPVSVQSPTHSASPTGSPKKVNQLRHRARSSISVNPRQRVLRYSDGRYTSQLFESNSWDSTGGLVSSPSGSPFRGFLTSQLKCMSCNFKSAVRYDKFDSLSLSLPPRGGGADMGYLLGTAKKGVTLEYLLHRFVSREIVEGVACEGCTLKRKEELGVVPSSNDESSAPVKATFLKWLNFGRLPKCLCFHIQRTTWFDNGQTSKRHDFVAFPEYLCMEMYTYLQASVRESKKSQLKALKEENPVNNRLSRSQQSLEMDKAEPKAPLSPPMKTEKSSLKMDMGIPSKSEGRLWHRPSIHRRNTFRLTAVVVHVGDSNSGHFVTYRRGPPQTTVRQKGLGSPFKRNGEVSYPLSRSGSLDDSRWYYTSDTEIVECSLNKVLESVAYMLFYEKVLPAQG